MTSSKREKPTIENFVYSATLYVKNLELQTSFSSRGWFKHQVGSIYFRSTSRYFKDYEMSAVKTLDIATISIAKSWQGKGAFSELIKELKKSTDRILFVESVLNDRFSEYLKRTGWTLDCPVNRNFFLKNENHVTD